MQHKKNSPSALFKKSLLEMGATEKLSVFLIRKISASRVCRVLFTFVSPGDVKYGLHLNSLPIPPAVKAKRISTSLLLIIKLLETRKLEDNLGASH